MKRGKTELAKFHLDQLKRKYGWKGGRYQDLISQVLAVNSENISRAVGRLSKDHYSRSLRSIKAGARRVILPDVSDALPKRSVFFLKSAERGKLLSDELRDKLTRDLREVVQPGFIRRRGPKAGTVSPEAIKLLEEKIAKTFAGHIKRAPKYGMPTNIHTIAVTELRINADQMRHDYTQTLIDKNQGKVQVVKTVIKNNNLVREPRPEHERLAAATRRRPVPFNQDFIYKTLDGRTIITPHMHHPSMPADQVCGCQCETEYRTVIV